MRFEISKNLLTTVVSTARLAYRLLYRSPLHELSGLGTHVRHKPHEGRAGKWKRVNLFKENWPMLRKRTFLKNHKSTQMDTFDKRNTSI